MRSKSALLMPVVMIALLLAVACPVQANSTRIKGGSGYGVQDTSPTGYSNCVANAGSFNNCEAFQVAPFTLTTNGTTYTVFQFSSNGFDSLSGDPTASNANNLDIFQISGATSPASFFMPLLNPALDSGIFFCNNGTNNFAVDSTSSPVTGLPCTVGTGSTNFNETVMSNGILFTFTGSFVDLTLYTQNGNLGTSSGVTAPEPSSLLLLGAGVLAFAGRVRRRTGWRKTSPALAT